MSNLMKDERFAGILRDPKFKKPRNHERKVQIDERFQSMFKNDAFKVKYSIDKRGRKVSGNSSEDFKRFYDLPSDEDPESSASEAESEPQELENEKSELEEKEGLPELTQEEEDEFRKKQITSKIRAKLKDMKIDYARGEGKLFSDSSSDESESDASEPDELYHEWNELDKDADFTNNITNRLAVCNMDWDRIRAVDLMVLFNSFLPPKSLICSVLIYPSEFGLKRMAEEEINGPAELVNNPNETDESENDYDDEENSDLHMERMRQYQLNRLKYYYAVITFDSPLTADYIYTNCNGVEYETSGIRLDLRFIDDEITFDQEPKDSCDSLDKSRKYEPTFFTTTALQQAKVDLTWDETDPRRSEFTRKISEAAKNNDINDSDLEDFVALSSSGEEDEKEGEEAVFEDTFLGDESANEIGSSDEEKDPIEHYKNLLKEIEENEKGDESDTELEITWGAEGNESSKTKISKKSEEVDENRTPFECLLRKNREKLKMKRKKKLQNQADGASGNENEEKSGIKGEDIKSVISDEDEHRKKELELLLLDNDDDNKHHFNLKKLQQEDKKKKKNRLKKKDKAKTLEDSDFQVDVNDDRFSALYSSHLFNIDPTNPKFTKTKGMTAFVEEKQKRISSKTVAETEQNTDDEPIIKRQKDNELSSLVKSIKNKAQTMLPNKKNKRR